jgi:hypothetical protein
MGVKVVSNFFCPANCFMATAHFYIENFRRAHPACHNGIPLSRHAAIALSCMGAKPTPKWLSRIWFCVRAGGNAIESDLDSISVSLMTLLRVLD